MDGEEILSQSLCWTDVLSVVVLRHDVLDMNLLGSAVLITDVLGLIGAVLELFVGGTVGIASTVLVLV